MDLYSDRLKVINREYSYSELVRLANSLGLTVVDPTEENYRLAILEWMEENNYGRNVFEDPFEDMPVEILLEIAKNTPDEDILNLCQTNTSFNILCNDVLFWSRRALDKGYISNLEEFETEERWPENNYGIRSPQERYLQLLSRYDCVPGSEKYVKGWKIGCAMAAGKRGNMKSINYFLEKGGNTNYAAGGAAYGGYINIVKVLMLDEDFNSAFVLPYAVKGGNIEIVKSLVEREDIDELDLNKALGVAAEVGHIAIVKYLVSKGAFDLESALRKAALNGNIEIVKYLVEEGAEDIDVPLIRAAEGGHIEIVKYLLSLGDIETFNIDEALSIAAKREHTDIVEYLVSLGAALKCPYCDSRNTSINIQSNKFPEDELSAVMVKCNNPRCMRRWMI